MSRISQEASVACQGGHEAIKSTNCKLRMCNTSTRVCNTSTKSMQVTTKSLTSASVFRSSTRFQNFSRLELDETDSLQDMSHFVKTTLDCQKELLQFNSLANDWFYPIDSTSRRITDHRPIHTRYEYYKKSEFITAFSKSGMTSQAALDQARRERVAV
jgi:hypothetical protein